MKSIWAITLFAEDLAKTRKFYEDVFDLEPINVDDSSAAYRLGETIINLLDIASAPELVEPATIAGPSAGARGVMTTVVEDVDAMCRRLEGLGVVIINGPMDRPWGPRTASFADPAGNIWEIAQ